MYSSCVFIAENRRLLPVLSHHMFVWEDFSQDKDVLAIKIKPGIPIVFFQPIPRLFIWAYGIIIPIKMGPKKKVLNVSTLLKSSWVECNFFPFSSPLLSLEFTRAQGSLLRMLKVALALTNVRWHLDRVYGLISYQILCVMEMCFARTSGSAMQRRWTSFHVKESERTFIYQLSMARVFLCSLIAYYKHQIGLLYNG